MPDKITKFIESLSEKVRRQLKKKIKALKQFPFTAPGVKKMQGEENLYRLRMGDIRVIYKVIDGNVVIIDIGYRGHVY